LKLLELARFQTNWPFGLDQLESWCSNAVVQPTALTPRLLAHAIQLQNQAGLKNSAARWESIWQIQEQTRAAYRAARQKWFAGVDEASSFHRIEAARQPLLPNVRRHQTNRVFRLDPPPFAPETSSADANAVVAYGNTGIRVATSPDATWVDLDEPWLVQPFNAHGPGDAFISRPETVIRKLVNEAVRDQNLPAYLDASVTVFGRCLREALLVHATLVTRPMPIGWKNIWVRPATAYLAPPDARVLLSGEWLSSTNSVQAAVGAVSGANDLQIAVYLTDPAALFAHQRLRTLWFAWLIAAAATAAVIGYVAAWRAFRRQQRLSEMKTNFVSSVSHELRAPIASVRLMAEGLERGKVSTLEKQREYFRFIVQECRRLSALVENVLDFSRIEQGGKQYDFEPTDLIGLVQHSAKLLEPIATDRQVHLALTLPPEPVTADVDGKAIQQALVNLIDNAIKFSPAGSEVTVGLEVTKSEIRSPKSETSNLNSEISCPVSRAPTPNPSTFRLFVEDHGEGIQPAEHERIFERFYRRGTELRRTTQGVGIGLSLVKHIVAAHGGRVRVRSAVGQGSRFTIELPPSKSEVRSPKSEGETS
jgi:signal transduction histidine kinase